MQGFRKQAFDVQQAIAAGEGKPSPENTSIFHEILLNPETRPQEKELDYLQDEAQTIIAAGTVTTGHVLSMTTFYILDNPAILQKLQSELEPLFPTPWPSTTTSPPPSWQRLEQLPYLTAIISEGLRICYGTSHRLQRLFPDRSLTHTDRDTGRAITIPPSTPVSMTSVHVHNDPTLFPDPRTFRPDRWLKDPSLKRYLLSFSRGTRQCLGMNLAWAELYLGLANVFAPGRFARVVVEEGEKGGKLVVKGMKPYETTLERDVEIQHDYLNVVASLESKGIRFLFDDLE